MPVGEIEGFPGWEEGRQKKQEEGGDWRFLSTCEHHVERCGVNVKDSRTQTGEHPQSAAPGGSGALSQRPRPVQGRPACYLLGAALAVLSLFQAERPQGLPIV